MLNPTVLVTQANAILPSPFQSLYLTYGKHTFGTPVWIPLAIAVFFFSRRRKG